MYKVKNAGRMRRTRKRKTNMTAQLARMTQMELRLSCIKASRPGWPRRRGQVVEVVVAKAADKTGEGGEADAEKRRV